MTFLAATLNARDFEHANFITREFYAILGNGVMSSLEGLFDSFGNTVDQAGYLVGQMPEEFAPNVWNLVENINMFVILPIAGVIFTALLAFELITLIMQKNSFAEIDHNLFLKWALKFIVGIVILANTFNIVNGIFAVSQFVIRSTSTAVTGDENPIEVEIGVPEGFTDALLAMQFGEILLLWVALIIIHFVLVFVNIGVVLIVINRFIEIFMYTSLAVVPMATLANSEMSHTGKNYIKTLLAIGFQGVLIVIILSIFGALMTDVLEGMAAASGGDFENNIWMIAGFGILLVFGLSKTGAISQKIMGAA